MHVLFGILVFI